MIMCVRLVNVGEVCLFQIIVKMSAAGDAANPGKAAASHPPYLQMIKDAIVEIGNKKGSSRPAITKHLLAKYPDIDGEKSRTYLRAAFRTGLKSEALVLARKEGKGAGSYKIAKVGAEKPKEKAEVVKKVEAPKKAIKKDGKGATKKATPKKVRKGSTASAKGGDEVKTKKGVKKSAEKSAKSPAAKKVGKGSATKTGKSPAKPVKKVGKSPAAKKAAAKKATAKSPVAKKAVKK